MSMNVFDPVLFSREENEFILAHVGEPPVVAARAVQAPVNAKAVLPVIESVYELIELEKHENMPWCGVEAVKAAAQTYLDQDAKWEADALRKRNAPRFPSMFAFDTRGKGHRYGVGSDSGRPRTYFAPDGTRKPFAISLVEEQAYEWEGPTAPAAEPGGLLVNTDARRIECTICGHTEKFNPDSRGSFNSARARMSKHLRNSTIEPDSHRALHTAEFA